MNVLLLGVLQSFFFPQRICWQWGVSVSALSARVFVSWRLLPLSVVQLPYMPVCDKCIQGAPQNIDPSLLLAALFGLFGQFCLELPVCAL